MSVLEGFGKIETSTSTYTKTLKLNMWRLPESSRRSLSFAPSCAKQTKNTRKRQSATRMQSRICRER